jgi:hypothetical protein
MYAFELPVPGLVYPGDAATHVVALYALLKKPMLHNVQPVDPEILEKAPGRHGK